MSYKNFMAYQFFVVENFVFVKHIFDKREKHLPKCKNKQQKVKL